MIDLQVQTEMQGFFCGWCNGQIQVQQIPCPAGCPGDEILGHFEVEQHECSGDVPKHSSLVTV